MRGNVSIIGPNIPILTACAETLRNFGLNVEHFESFDPFIRDALQGTDYDAVLALHSPPDIDILKESQTIVQEHRQHIPFVIVVPDSLNELKGKISLSPGVFSIHSSSASEGQISHSVVQAAAQKQLFRLIEAMANEHRKLASLAHTLVSATNQLYSLHDENVRETSDLIQSSLQKLRGRDPEKELEKSELAQAEILGRTEKIRRLLLKN